jgi:hypothetical protein
MNGEMPELFAIIWKSDVDHFAFEPTNLVPWKLKRVFIGAVQGYYPQSSKLAHFSGGS